MTGTVSFYLNGKQVELSDFSPSLLLIDYLRSPEVSLAGAKKGCGQGGCGACTVILSRWDNDKQQAEHKSINSCLRPVAALNGLSVTTIEGTGGTVRQPPRHPVQTLASSRGKAPFGQERAEHLETAQEKTRLLRQVSDQQGKWRTSSEMRGATATLEQAAKAKGLEIIPVTQVAQEESGTVDVDCLPDIDPSINPVAYRLAVNNGSQCGYCSTGFVMNMSAFLANHSRPTKKQIEDAFDGNICRCTGYRPILTAMKTFAVDWSEEDEANRMKLILDDQVQAQQVGNRVTIPFPDGAKSPRGNAYLSYDEQVWLTVTSVDELVRLYSEHQASDIYLIHANTSFGVYPDDLLEHQILVDISQLSELYETRGDTNSLTVGAGVTYTELLDFIDHTYGDVAETTAVGAVKFMAERTAGRIVRNAASLGGNTQLVLKHMAAHTGAPFPSDLFTILSALDTQISFLSLTTNQYHSMTASQLVSACLADPTFPSSILLLKYDIGLLDESVSVLSQKVALRDINAHSIVNAGTIMSMNEQGQIDRVNLTFGALAPYPWRASKTEAFLSNRAFSLDEFPLVAAILSDEIAHVLELWADRMAEVEYEGFSDQYRIELAVSFVYKALVTLLLQYQPQKVPESERSSAEITWGNWPVSDGRQYYKNQSFKAPVSQPYVKLMALYQTSGQVRYTHEMEVPPTALNAAFVQSTQALAQFHFIHPETQANVSAAQLSDYLAAKYSGFTRLITCEDIPQQGVNLIGMGGDQPVFASSQVNYVGQSLALVLGRDEVMTQRIADYVSAQCVYYEPVDWSPDWQAPILDLDDAIHKGSIFPDYPSTANYVSHIWKIIRNHSQFSWSDEGKDPLDKSIAVREVYIDGARCQVVESTQTSGGQIHFYMETQSCVAKPGEGEVMHLYPSSQSPMEMHQTAAAVLGVEHNQIGVHLRQLGGGYGGKTEQAKFVMAATAVAANTVNGPVRLVMPRNNDSSMIGKRHPYYGQYQIAINDGSENPEDKGVIKGMDFKIYGDGGAFYDCSFIVANCLQTRIDNAYMVPNFRSALDVCRTNTAPNTAFRSFGDIQGKLISENAIDDAAFVIGMEPEDVRERNLYKRGDVTPFGQALTYCYIREVWQYLKQKADFAKRKAAVHRFNQQNKWRKRGIYMLPVKYGSGYNLVQLEQATALISVYSGDGTVVINQGGSDMGQGMVTKIEQVASYILNVPMDKIRINLPNTEVVPNPTSTGGSTGTAYNGLAVKQTCERLRARLMEFGMEMRNEMGDEACALQGLDYWNYPEGWAKEVNGRLIWQNLIGLAYTKRITLVESFNAQVPGGEDPMPVLDFKTKQQAEAGAIPGISIAATIVPGSFDSFCGFTYSAACSEVEVDILTGEVKILRTDLMYDMGWSINPALDIGQVEGAFVQGVGYVMTEKLVFEPSGDEQGRLNSVNTWQYKPPAITNIPLEFNVHLFPRDQADSVPENPNELLSAKEVGEPPLVLAASVFFAIKAAVRTSRLERGLDGLFTLDAPATVQEVRRACEVDFV